MTTPFPLGRHDDAPANHDPRSRSFAALADLPVRTKAWRRYGAVLDQGDLGSCTGNAGTHAQNHAPYHRTGEHVGTQADARDLYSAATAIDPYPGQWPDDDTGSDGLAIGKVLKARGKVTEYRWAFGLDHVLATAMVGPVMLGTVWRSGMFYPSESGMVYPTGSEVGGHEYLLTGVNTAGRIVRCQNSWGPGWGDYGKFYMTYAALAELLAAGGDALLLLR